MISRHGKLFVEIPDMIRANRAVQHASGLADLLAWEHELPPPERDALTRALFECLVQARGTVEEWRQAVAGSEPLDDAFRLKVESAFDRFHPGFLRLLHDAPESEKSHLFAIVCRAFLTTARRRWLEEDPPPAVAGGIAT